MSSSKGTLVVHNTDIHVVSVGAQGPRGATGLPGIGDGSNDIELAAGENLSAGDPVKVVGNLVYKASHTEANPVVGLIRSDTLLGFPTTICTTGKMALTGLSTGSAYFLGDRSISTAAPSSGFVVRLGTAVTATVFVVNIEEPIFLS